MEPNGERYPSVPVPFRQTCIENEKKTASPLLF
jgi:hypothetical protein